MKHFIPKLALVAVFLVTLPTQVLSQILWQNLSAGMSEAQVKELYPGPTPRTTLFAKAFTIRFSYEDGGLSKVVLLHDGKLDAGDAKELFNRLVTALRSKYGPEKGRQTDADIRTRVTWVTNDKVGVEIDWLHAGHHNMVNINYSKALPSEADKL